MSQKTAGKIGLILLCIGIAVGSVIGILTGIFCLVMSGDYGWLALIIGPALLFIGAVYGIFKFTSSKRAPQVEREKKSPRNTKIWVTVAFGSGAGAILVYFFGIEIGFEFWPVIIFIIIALLVVLCLYLIFVSISGGRRREEKITNLISPTDDETNNSIEETIKKIEQND